MYPVPVAEFIDPWLEDKSTPGSVVVPARQATWLAGTTTICRRWLYPPVRDLWIGYRYPMFRIWILRSVSFLASHDPSINKQKVENWCKCSYRKLSNKQKHLRKKTNFFVLKATEEKSRIYIRIHIKTHGSGTLLVTKSDLTRACPVHYVP